MKIKLLPQVLFIAIFNLTFLLLGNAEVVPSSNYDCLSNGKGVITDLPSKFIAYAIDEPDRPKNKKANRKKKMPRRKCVYCPPMRSFEKGQWEANFSYGLVPTYLMDKVDVKMPPLNLGAEYRFSERFSLGATIGSSISESQPKIVADGIFANWTNAHVIMGLRPGVHVTRIENWDFYGGFSIGLNYSHVVGQVSQSTFDLNEMEDHMGIKEHVLSPSFFGYTGVKYAINPKWMAHSEIGFGISIFSMGLSYLIK